MRNRKYNGSSVKHSKSSLKCMFSFVVVFLKKDRKKDFICFVWWWYGLDFLENLVNKRNIWCVWLKWNLNADTTWEFFCLGSFVFWLNVFTEENLRNVHIWVTFFYFFLMNHMLTGFNKEKIEWKNFVRKKNIPKVKNR